MSCFHIIDVMWDDVLFLPFLADHGLPLLPYVRERQELEPRSDHSTGVIQVAGSQHAVYT